MESGWDGPPTQVGRVGKPILLTTVFETRTADAQAVRWQTIFGEHSAMNSGR